MEDVFPCFRALELLVSIWKKNTEHGPPVLHITGHDIHQNYRNHNAESQALTVTPGVGECGTVVGYPDLLGSQDILRAAIGQLGPAGILTIRKPGYLKLGCS